MKNISRVFLISITLIIASLLILGCSSNQSITKENAYLVITDESNKEVVLEKKPERIIPLSPSYLGIFEALDGKIVGRVANKNGVPKVYENIEEVGNVYNVSLEKVISLKPDLVILYKGVNDKLADTFKENNIHAIVLDMRTLDQIKNTIKVISEVLGKKAEGEKLNEDMDKKIKEIVDRYPNPGKKIVILHSTSQQVTVQLDNSIAGDISKTLNLNNIATNLSPLKDNTTSAPYSLETIVENDPDVILVTSMGKIESIKKSMEQNVESSPAWNSLSAVKNKKVKYLPQELFLVSPGLKYPEAVSYMAREVYGK